MCRIASLFLLQRLKGSMSGDARDFNNIETRALITFFSPLQGKAPKEIHAILAETLGEHALSYATIKNWVAHFKRGDFSTYDAPRPGRPKTVTTPEIIDQIHELILEERRAGFRLNQQLRNWASHVSGLGPSFMKIWTCGKLIAMWVPKCLYADQKRQRCHSSEQIWNFFGPMQMISYHD